jgi:hypothetical protein
MLEYYRAGLYGRECRSTIFFYTLKGELFLDGRVM